MIIFLDHFSEGFRPLTAGLLSGPFACLYLKKNYILDLKT